MLRRGLLALSLVWVAAGCTRVAAYERGRLAHPTMAAEEDFGAGRTHLYAVQEGAAGGSVTRASGCGCN